MKKIPIFVAIVFSTILNAQETTANNTQGFWDIVRGGTDSINYVSVLIWILLFLASMLALTIIINNFVNFRREKVLPSALIDEINQAFAETNLEKAIQSCEGSSSPLATVLISGLSNVDQEYQVIEDVINSSSVLESEKMLQKVRTLDVIGQVAPMLGLLGTVTGMISAFAGLASAGANKETLLALSISNALWTTTVGLLIALPAIAAFSLLRNKVTTLTIELSIIVQNIFKELRN